MSDIFNKTAWVKILKHKDKSDPNIKIDLQIFLCEHTKRFMFSAKSGIFSFSGA